MFAAVEVMVRDLSSSANPAPDHLAQHNYIPMPSRGMLTTLPACHGWEISHPPQDFSARLGACDFCLCTLLQGERPGDTLDVRRRKGNCPQVAGEPPLKRFGRSAGLRIPPRVMLPQECSRRWTKSNVRLNL